MSGLNRFSQFAALSGLLAVALGAFAAHGLKNSLTTYELKIWNTAVFYQFIHTLLLLFIANYKPFLSKKMRLTKIACFSSSVGIILFSGSLYLMALLKFSGLGLLTPIGGTFFIIAWSLLFYLFTTTKDD